MTDITLPRATVGQALEALKYLRDTAICSADTDTANEVIPDLEAALTQQAEPVEPVAWRDSDNSDPGQGCTYDKAKAARWPHIYKQPLYTAPPQQAEPDHETRAELAEQQVVQLAEERDHYRNLWQKAQQAEPDWQDLYLKEKQRADMWRDKYESVAGAEQRIYPQAEPVEPVAEPVAAERERCAEYLMQQAAECREDSPTRVTLESCAAVLRLGLHAQAEPVEPVAWRVGSFLYGHYDCIPSYLLPPAQQPLPLYTAPPQRKPLTSDKDRPDQGATYVEGYGYVDTRAVRAVERAHNITDPQIADRLARHGIPMPGDPK